MKEFLWLGFSISNV